MKPKSAHFSFYEYVLFLLVTLAAMCLCLCIGSVSIPLRDTLRTLRDALTGQLQDDATSAILLSTRLPRVLCVALCGAALSLAGAAMQGLLKNPLADGSTLGVSSGASLGAVLAIAFGLSFPGLPFAGSMVMAVIFAFLSLLLILGLAYKIPSACRAHLEGNPLWSLLVQCPWSQDDAIKHVEHPHKTRMQILSPGANNSTSRDKFSAQAIFSYHAT